MVSRRVLHQARSDRAVALAQPRREHQAAAADRHIRDRRPTDFGIPDNNGRPLDSITTRFTVGQRRAADETNATMDTATATLTHASTTAGRAQRGCVLRF